MPVAIAIVAVAASIGSQIYAGVAEDAALNEQEKYDRARLKLLADGTYAYEHVPGATKQSLTPAGRVATAKAFDMAGPTTTDFQDAFNSIEKELAMAEDASTATAGAAAAATQQQVAAKTTTSNALWIGGALLAVVAILVLVRFVKR